MPIIARSQLASLPHKEVPTAASPLDGYGKRRHPTRWMVQLPGGTRWRRVYCCCISNSGTSYVEVRGKGKKPDWHVIE